MQAASIAVGDLHEAKLRAVSLLAHEFGVESERWCARGAGEECCQRIGSIDHQGRRSPGDVYNRRAIMLVNLRAVLARVVDIVLLRAGPETLPASTGLLAVVVAVNVAVSAVGDRVHADRSAKLAVPVAGRNDRDAAVVPAGLCARQQTRTLPADRDGNFCHDHAVPAGTHPAGHRTAAVPRASPIRRSIRLRR